MKNSHLSWHPQVQGAILDRFVRGFWHVLCTEEPGSSCFIRKRSPLISPAESHLSITLTAISTESQ